MEKRILGKYNVLKACVEKEENVKRLVVRTVQQDEKIEKAELQISTRWELNRLLEDFKAVLSDTHGNTELVEMSVNIDEALPISQTHYRLQESFIKIR